MIRFLGAAQVIHDAYAMHLSTPSNDLLQAESAQDVMRKKQKSATGKIQRTVRNVTDYQIIDHVQAGKVIRVVQELPDRERNWILFTYPPDLFCTREVIAAVTKNLWYEFKNRKPKTVKLKTKLKLRQLCPYAAVDNRYRFWSPQEYSVGATGLKSRDLAAMLDVSPSNYAHTYSPHWDTMGQIIDGWDKRGKGPVAHLCNVERQKVFDEQEAALAKDLSICPKTGQGIFTA